MPKRVLGSFVSLLILLFGSLVALAPRGAAATTAVEIRMPDPDGYVYDGTARSIERTISERGKAEDRVHNRMLRGSSVSHKVSLRLETSAYDAHQLSCVSRTSVATKASPCHSFRYDTTVLMADGTRKRISDVAIGDHVLTTDPETGERVVREVTELHVNADIDMANVTVRDADGNVSIIYTTQSHQFWSQTDSEWVEAKALDEGEVLRAFDGSKVTVVGVRTWDGYQTMYDLTVEGVHSYYVTAGNEEVLVHNCGEGMLGENGTQITSKTLTPPNRSYRIDVENPAPGMRPGQLHLQDTAGGKYLYNFETGVFEGIPKALAKEIAKDPAVARAIAKGASALGLG